MAEPVEKLPDSEADDLPAARVDRLSRAFGRFFRIEAAAGAVLMLSALGALLLSNSPWSAALFMGLWDTEIGIEIGGSRYSRSLRHWINDGLMTLFFFVVALELKREAVLGELRSRRAAALPIAGAVGGMIGPALVFSLVARGTAGAHGWGVVVATDTAFVIGSLARLGARVPASLRVFLVCSTIFDDIGAVLIVAFGYGSGIDTDIGFVAAGVLGVIALAERVGIRSVPLYVGLGIALWLAVDASGLHPSAAGLALGLMTPARSWVSDSRLQTALRRVLAYPAGDHWSGDTQDRRDLLQARTATREALSPLERIEIDLHPWVAFAVLPLFALSNAGLSMNASKIDADVAGAVFIGLAVGKPIGVLGFAWLALAIGMAVRPAGLTWPQLAAGAILSGIGFTMSLFVADLAFDGALLDSAKCGVLLASAVSGLVGITLLHLATRESRKPPDRFRPSRSGSSEA